MGWKARGHFQGEAGLGLSREFPPPSLSSALLASKILGPLHLEPWGDPTAHEVTLQGR